MAECVGNTTIPPPPPVLPPPFSVANESHHKKTLWPITKGLSLANSEDDLIKAKLEIWRDNSIEDDPLISFYRHVDPILQEGPTCGLVALSMASACTGQQISVEKLLHEAKDRGFTNHGEMFSVDYMAKLAQETLKDCSSVEILQSGLTLDRERIIAMITNGSILLVPYDADKNHSPSNLRGHKAHWAVILGVLRSNKTCHLIARHGKSRHLGVWQYDKLQSSNENLMELDPTREDDGKSYVLPHGGVAMGLCGRAVLLHNLPKSMSRHLQKK